MTEVHNLEEQLRRDEGEVLHEYKDHLGYSTIGVGRLIDKRRGGGITREESDFLLANDILQVKKEVIRNLPWVRDLTPERQGVLLNMAFQMGVAGLMGFKVTLGWIRQGRYEDAARGMLNSLWAKQTPSRAKRLSEQMRTSKWH